MSHEKTRTVVKGKFMSWQHQFKLILSKFCLSNRQDREFTLFQSTFSLAENIFEQQKKVNNNYSLVQNVSKVCYKN